MIHYQSHEEGIITQEICVFCITQKICVFCTLHSYTSVRRCIVVQS